ncbi:cold shock domain-containing protein [Raoultella ornithinolytica]
MDGVIKWFSEEQGYGFITDKNNNDYYFHVTNVKGALLPKNGHSVHFDIKNNKAKNISLINKKESIFKLSSLDYRKAIFDLYKDFFVCIAIAVLGVYLIKNNHEFIGWLAYFVACILAILASFTTHTLFEEKRQRREISKFDYAIFIFFSVSSILILAFGLVKGIADLKSII